MWTTLALAAVLTTAPAQADQLILNNARGTYGVLGPERKDSKLLPGERYVIAFDLEGLKAAEDGEVSYSIGLEVTDSKGKVIYGKEPSPRKCRCTLGAARLPAFTFVEADQIPAGEYSATVIVVDKTTKATGKLTRKFEWLPPDFGIVQAHFSYDFNGNVNAPPGGAPGQLIFLHFATVGFERDGRTKQPNIAAEIRVFDEKGEPTLPKSLTGVIKDEVGAKDFLLPWNPELSLTRAGKFTVEIKATDRVSKKVAKLTLPLSVVEQKASE